MGDRAGSSPVARTLVKAGRRSFINISQFFIFCTIFKASDEDIVSSLRRLVKRLFDDFIGILKDMPDFRLCRCTRYDY